MVSETIRIFRRISWQCVDQATPSTPPFGAPRTITVDNGSECTSRVMDAGAYRHKIQLDCIRSDKLAENGFIESFNGRLRDECLNVEVFFTLADVREKLTRWQRDYNLVRPHSALEDHAPASFVAEWIAAITPTGQDAKDLLVALT